MGKGPAPDPGDVGLGHAHDPLDVAGADAGADQGPAGDRVGRGDERIGAVVEVEEGGLGPLEEHVLAVLHGVVDEPDGVGDQRLEAGGELAQVAVGDVVGRQRQAVEDLGQDQVLLFEDHLELLAEDLGVEQVLDPQAHPGRLVGVGRADAALGGAQAVLAQPALGEAVELGVVRHDHVGVAADQQPAAVDAAGLEAVDLADQHAGVDDHAVADDRRDPWVEDPARDELEGERLVLDDDGVAGVVPALVAHHDLHVGGEEVGELALPLVAPLGAHDNCSGHARLLDLCPTAVLQSYRTGAGLGIPEEALKSRGPPADTGAAATSPRPHKQGEPGSALLLPPGERHPATPFRRGAGPPPEPPPGAALRAAVGAIHGGGLRPLLVAGAKASEPRSALAPACCC